jgi:hypothetical protein
VNRKTLLWGLLALATAIAVGFGHPAGAMTDEDCQGCHADSSLVSSSGRSPYIDPAKYASTTHAQEGCSSCHQSVTEAHPLDGVTVPKAACGDCHQEIEDEYAGSKHSGNAGCSDCHNPHAVRNAAAVSGFDLNRRCSSCHDPKDMATGHAKWLPQAQLHLTAVPCITCHTGSENYVITLYLEARDKPARPGEERKLSSYESLAEAAGTPDIQSIIDRNSDGFISVSELREFHGRSRFEGLRLWGMMMPQVMTHTYDILDNRWDCTFCHASGPSAAQTSFVAFPQEDGTYVRVPVEKGAILDILYGTPDFYMMGATRNDTLSVIGLAIIAAGLAMPIGHGTLRFFTRRNRKEP